MPCGRRGSSPHDVWREAVLAEEGMEPVMPQVVEGAGQIQEGSRGAAAAVEVIDLTTGKSRAVHLRACPVRLAQAAAAPPPAPPPPPLRSAESVRHMLECPALAAIRLHHDIHPNDDPPPVTEALTDYRWVAFLRAALALVAPPAPQPVGPPLVE